ncbi:MAG: hypothetical protein JSW25_08605 [Thermoplasmata archaeon]|nr:MAG: hypothetical protein JSW25_08605 [Thermoplasmata archaeon]
MSLLLGLLALALVATPGAAEDRELDTVLFLHWVNDGEPSRDLGGHSVRNFMDTTTGWEDTNRSVTSGSNWEEDWYLHPLLAEDLTTDNVTLGLWMNASGGQKRAQISVSILDVADASSDPYGQVVAEANYGNTPLFATPHFMTFPLEFSPYTFSAGHSIRVLISMTPGTSTFVTIIWDTATADSRLTITTEDRLDLPQVGVKDSQGEPTTGLDPMAEDKDVTLFAVTTDPLGVYDVAMVKATLEGPDGTVIVDNASMDRPSLPPGSSPAEFSLGWDYEGAETGRYTLTVWAVELTGTNHRDHFGHGTYGDYPIIVSTQFTIGEVYTVHVLCLDGGDRPVEGAAVSSGPREEPAVTGEDGRTVLVVFGGTVVLTAVWHDVAVGQLTIDVDADVPESDPAVIECAIYEVSLRTVDGRGDPLAEATVQVTPPAGYGTPLLALTDGDGMVTLGLVPGADHAVVVLWKGFGVADTTFSPEADGTIDVPCAVHWATFHVTDADDGPLPSVQLVAMDMGTLGVVGFGTTDGNGTISMRLPDTSYRVEVYWRNTMVLRMDDLVLDGGDLEDTLACRVFRATVEVVDRHGEALPRVPVVLEDDTGAVVSTEISDDEGLVVFQLGEGSYRAIGLLQTTYRWTAIDMEEAVQLDVNASGDYTLEFDQYPPGILGTVQFWTMFTVLFIFCVMMYIVMLWRRSLRLDDDEEGPEDDSGGKDDGDVAVNSTGIEVEPNPKILPVEDE